MQKIDKKTLKEYLIYRDILTDDGYNVEKISSAIKVKNQMGEDAISISMQFSLNDGKELYSDNVSIHYETYKIFLLKQRKQKIDKICLNKKL